MMFPRVALERIPDTQVLFVQEQIRQHVLNVIMLAHRRPAGERAHRMGWLRWFGMAMAALIVVPLARFFTLTSRRSVDPAVPT